MSSLIGLAWRGTRGTEDFSPPHVQDLDLLADALAIGKEKCNRLVGSCGDVRAHPQRWLSADALHSWALTQVCICRAITARASALQPDFYVPC